jgi:kynurenine formamidase
MTTWLGIGSQIDGLGHVGIDHVYYNGVHAKDFTQVTGVTKFSISNVPPIVARGILLDIAHLKGLTVLEAGYAINRTEIQTAAKTQGVEIRKGDVVLFHTGWLNLAAKEPERFMRGEPGLGMDGGKFLAEIGVIAVGSDTFGLEAIPFETKGQIFPVHQELLTKKGIYILENMDTRELAKDRAWEFLFVLGQPRLVGAVQAIINPVAIR